MTVMMPLLLSLVAIVFVIFWAIRANANANAAGQSAEPCPDCGLRIPADESRCLRCGWEITSTTAPPQRVVKQLRRHLDLLSARKLLSREVTQQLQSALDGELQRLAALAVSAKSTTAASLTPSTPSSAPIVLDAAVLDPASLPGSTTVTVEEHLPPVTEPPQGADSATGELARPGSTENVPYGARPRVTPKRSLSHRSPDSRPAEPIWIDEPATLETRSSSPAEPASRKHDWLLAFMEQRNLNWGELIGGLLIVCGSIAMVISFWSQIANSPFLKFIVFNGFTAALFGVGRYAGQRLQLPSTSRAFYAIGSLLIPFNFLALAAFTKGTSTDALTLVGELITTVLFGWLSWRAGKVLAPSAPGAFALGLIGPSLANLVLGRMQISGASPPRVLMYGLYPTLVYVAAHILRVRAAPDGLAIVVTPSPGVPADSNTVSPPPDDRDTGWWSLATSSLAVLVPLGLMLYRSENVHFLRHSLAPLFPLLAFPALSQGLLRSKATERGAATMELLAATTLCFLALCIIGLGQALAWPWTAPIILTSVVGTLVLATVAVWHKRPALWLAALPGLTITWLLVLGMFRGQVAWQGIDPGQLRLAFTAPETGNSLIPLVLSTLIGVAAAKRRFPHDARWLLVGSGILASLSLLSILLFGFGRTGDHGGSTFSLLLYGLLALLAAAVLEKPLGIHQHDGSAESLSDPARRSVITETVAPVNSVASMYSLASVGMILLVLASVQGLYFRWPGSVEYSRPAVLLMSTSLITLFLGAMSSHGLQRLIGSSRKVASRLPAFLTLGGIGLSSLAMGEVAIHFFRIPLGGLAWQVLWSACLWLALAWLRRSDSAMAPPIFSGFQLLLTAASLCGARQWLQSHPWSDPAPRLGRDPRTWQLLGIILTGQALAWLWLRIAAARRAKTTTSTLSEQLLASPTLSGDRMLATLALVGVLAVSVYAALPGTMRELSPRNVALARSSPDLVEQARLAHDATQLAARARGEPESTKPFRVVPPLTSYEWAATPHEPAGGWGTWVWLGLVVCLWLGWQTHCPAWPTAANWSLALAAACPLVASHWDRDVATASAWRWGMAVWLTLLASLVWGSRVRQSPDSTGWLSQRMADFEPHRKKLADFGQWAMLGVLCTMVLIVGALLSRQPDLWEMWRTPLYITGWLALVTALLGIALQLPMIVMTRIARQTDPDATLPPLVQRFSSPVTFASCLTWILGIGPLMAVVLFVCNGALRTNPLVGPEPGTFFHQVGTAASYATPLVVWALVLIGHAICFSEGAYVFGAGLLLQISTTSIIAFLAARAGRPLDQSLSLELILWNSLVASLAAIGWQVGRKRLGLSTPLPGDNSGLDHGWNPTGFSPLLITQCLLGVSLWLISQIPVAWSMASHRDGIAAQQVFQSLLAWISWGMALGAIASPLGWQSIRTGHLWRTVALGSGALLIAHTLAQHTLSIGIPPWPLLRLSLIVGAVLLWWLEVGVRHRKAALTGGTPGTSVPGVALLATLALILTLVEISHAGGTQWTTWELRGLGLLALLHVLWSQDRRWLWISALLLPFAEVSRWLFARPAGVSEFTGLLNRGDVVWLSLLPTALVALGQDVRSGTRKNMVNSGTSSPLSPVSFQRGVGWLGVGWFALTLILEAFAGGLSASVPATHLWIEIGLVSLWILCLADGRRESTLLPLYLSGLLLFASLPGALASKLPWRLTFQGQVLSGYTALSYLLWWRRSDFDRVAEWLGISEFHRNAATNQRWLARGTQFVATLVLVITLITVWTEVTTATEPLRRVQMATAAWTPVIVLALLCRTSADGRMAGRILRRAAFASIFWAWAWFPLNWLLVRFAVQAAALLLLALSLSQLVSHWSRLSENWRTAIQKILPWLMGIGLVTSLFIIGLEATVLQPARTREEYVAVGIVAGALILFAGLCLAAALIPGRDPLRLSESRKTLWVYAAEGLLALLFLHLRLALPWLFAGIFQAYWPFFILLLAFAGLGLAELFRRQNRPILSVPLENTGIWLPLLPLLGFWLNSSTGQGSLSLLLGGLFYGVMSVRQKSAALGMLSALAINGALWWQFQHLDGYGLLQHPQLWLIPFALCLLAASWIHRERLTARQRSILRHFSATLIYTSSTIDIFLNGLANNPWLAVVLAGLSILGVLAGMLLKVRSFLFQGTAFLCVSLLTLLWHAAFHLHQTWLIWLTVIFAGVAILTLFAMFERKRQQMIDLVSQVREWSD